MIRTSLSQGLLCFAACLAACTQVGTETDNPITEFRSSECKGGAGETALTVAALQPPGADLTTAEPMNRMAGPEYDGLFCVAWEASDDGALSIELYNLDGGCHVTWDVQAQREGAGIALGLQPHNCVIAACGSCTYDLGFELEGIDTSAALALAVREISCSSTAGEEIAELELPLDERSEGVICRPQPRSFSGLDALCGAAHLPVCNDESPGDSDECGERDAPPCAEGLVCEPGEHDVCLTACEEDDDCPLAIERCEEGACKLRETF